MPQADVAPVNSLEKKFRLPNAAPKQVNAGTRYAVDVFPLRRPPFGTIGASAKRGPTLWSDPPFPASPRNGHPTTTWGCAGCPLTGRNCPRSSDNNGCSVHVIHHTLGEGLASTVSSATISAGFRPYQSGTTQDWIKVKCLEWRERTSGARNFSKTSCRKNAAAPRQLFWRVPQGGQAPLVRNSVCNWRRASSRLRRMLTEWNAQRTVTKTVIAANDAMYSGAMVMNINASPPPMCAIV